MGKRIISQRRGSKNPRYTAPSHKFKADTKHPPLQYGELTGVVKDIIKCPAHTSPLAKIECKNGLQVIMIAPELISVGDEIELGGKKVKVGNTLQLKNIPEGTQVFNLEAVPGDGGKFVRSSGAFAKIVGSQDNKIIVILPSKKQKLFNENCRATVGIVSGGGRTEKPLVKAGNAFYKMKARRHLWPKVSGGAMNAVDHPFGNKRSSRKSKARVSPKNAPPGRKVGMVRAKRSGRKKK